MLPFVREFVETPAGPVPRVRTRPDWRDRFGTLRARLGFRNDYKIVPGLYCVGRPGPDSPVLVTCNYKLTFDALRRELGDTDAWLLALDTHGVNVWCAAAKGVLSTEEVARRVRAANLAAIVSHRVLTLPQLAAPGVSAHKLKGLCGFSVRFGPIRAGDLRAYLERGEADEAMRRVEFPLAERLVLAPVELTQRLHWLVLLCLLCFALSGLGPEGYSLSLALRRGLLACAATLTGLLAGVLLVPALLPLLPGRAFSAKGAVAGGAAFLPLALAAAGFADVWELAALGCWTVGLGSYLGMNFTGSTPFTSPTGVEKEMRRAMPLQAACLLASLILWVGAPFWGNAL